MQEEMPLVHIGVSIAGANTEKQQMHLSDILPAIIGVGALPEDRILVH
jgi:hypothetical protein